MAEFLLFTAAFRGFSQSSGDAPVDADLWSRGSIPQELLRPRRDESPRYPLDTVIGVLGRGEASTEAYAFARKTASALVAGKMNDAVFSSVNTVLLENYLSSLDGVKPLSFRLGSGREEADGSYSFLVRFIGREQSITGELFVRKEAQKNKTASDAGSSSNAEMEGIAERNEAVDAAPLPAVQIWIFDELILEEARSKQSENEEVKHRFDFPPYERFF